MPRIDRVNEEIRHCLASLLMSVKDPRVHGVVSIVHVDTTPDFKQSRVYISVLNDSDTQEVLKGLKSASGFLRRELGRSLDLRNTPELFFVKDESIKYGSHILDLLHSIKPAPGSADDAAENSAPVSDPAAGEDSDDDDFIENEDEDDDDR
jgi:ribosome-binding factor A